MVRTQIQLTEEQAERLRDLAHERDTSMAALVREAVDRLLAGTPHLTRRERMDRALAAAGKYRSGCSDVSERHDEYFADAIESRWRRS